MSAPETVQALLADGDWGRRLHGVEQCRQLAPTAAMGLLKEVITDRNARVRYAAVSQLGNMVGLSPTQKQELLPLLRERLYGDSEADVQAAAADALAGLGLTEAYEDLERAYRESPEWLVKFSVIAGLGVLGDARAYSVLLEALDADIDLLQLAAIGALADLGDVRAVSRLGKLVTHPDWQVRLRLAQALQRLNSPDAQPFLATLAQDDMDLVAQAARG
ncbi:HEAT repeat-containing PBS lyase [Gloeomargarita lithophora Alchichica-D10]|uniref:HEAT repeat-containing PBS lyase n=1 Tax=Gloeomargarita lithophora Alchichica-D10 TaxID=1188229 RepID=A0A1J0AFV6_9CYAN|nr:HEAT repeat domain-containing protein [Gloeomargarita lithophora]APB34787.1 HEAT repeat-containing PBS lyase [Gloeomargarita lithophora Alchichica-D10]